MERSYHPHPQHDYDPYSSGYPGMGLDEKQWFSVQGDVDDFIFYEPDSFDSLPFDDEGHSRR